MSDGQTFRRKLRQNPTEIPSDLWSKLTSFLQKRGEFFKKRFLVRWNILSDVPSDLSARRNIRRDIPSDKEYLTPELEFVFISDGEKEREAAHELEREREGAPWVAAGSLTPAAGFAAAVV